MNLFYLPLILAMKKPHGQVAMGNNTNDNDDPRMFGGGSRLMTRTGKAAIRTTREHRGEKTIDLGEHGRASSLPFRMPTM